ncbi:MAG: asparagine synthase (glutamine-hydrolyzing) [Kiloniellaceae bacterium]|nr:asparagine synthase (glutamine-hydrolyzing) [Kiloniellaceae bacterium]
MCGIYGLVALREGADCDPSLLDAMAEVTFHRGPDDEGRHSDRGLAMGMRRLSIIDLSTGHQPIPNQDETVWTVCNGEIYNFRELRRDLQGAGAQFRTGSDTEVLVHLYERYGTGFVTRLLGMFGFAIWDAPRRRLLLGRDRLGIKPLYYMEHEGRLIFASEIKALLTLPGVGRAIDPGALQDYLTFGYSGKTQTLFKGIRKLPPASLLVCENGSYTIETYWQAPAEADASLSEDEWAEQLRAAIEAAVVSEMVSDVPLGAFLSGGIDSSAIVAFMARHSDRPVKTYSIGFKGDAASEVYNELPFARQVAEQFATDHREIIVRPEVARLLPKLAWHLDEPVADSASVTTYLVGEFARQDVTVILSGVGGDELFGGYNRYLGDYYAGQYQRLPGWMRKAVIAPLVQAMPSDRHGRLSGVARYARTFVASNDLPFEERYRSYLQVFGAESLQRLMKQTQAGHVDSLQEAFALAASGDSLNRLMRVDLATQMPNDLLMLTDKMTMASSLECRVPLLNHELVELAARVPAALRIEGRNLKSLMKRALDDVLPREILDRKKRGFGAPLGAWLKRDLQPMMGRLLSKQAVEARGLLSWPVIEETMALHLANREDHTDHLLALLNLEIWAQIYLDGRAADDLAGELGAEVAAAG